MKATQTNEFDGSARHHQEGIIPVSATTATRRTQVRLPMKSFCPSIALFCGIILLQAVVCGTAWAKDWPIEVQRVVLKADVTPNKIVGEGTGHFTKDYDKGVAINDRQILAGNKFNGVSFEKKADGKGAPWGSDGYVKGVVFRNDAKIMGKEQIIESIVITLLVKTDTFDGSDGGSDFKVEPGTDGDGYPTLTITAKAGKALQPGDQLWMRVPSTGEGESRNKFKGYLTGKPAPGPLETTGVPQPLTPSFGSSSSTLVSFDFSSSSLTFSATSVSVAEYCDGSSTFTNDPSETIIGSSMTVADTNLLGPASIPGAFSFSDTVLSTQQDDAVRVDGTLTDVLVVPDNSVPGFDSVVVANLVWEGSAVDLTSRYLIEKFYRSNDVAVFFRSNLLSATGNLTHDGEASGPLQLSAIAGPGNCAPAF
jgi:hypothetical protein